MDTKFIHEIYQVINQGQSVVFRVKDSPKIQCFIIPEVMLKVQHQSSIVEHQVLLLTLLCSFTALDQKLANTYFALPLNYIFKNSP